MGKKEFKATVSTISGGSVSNILKIFKGNPVEPEYYPRVISTFLFSLFAEPFRWWEHFRYDRKINKLQFEKDPVFILGHWRSGTTYLHNLLCEDPQMGFVTTYQGVFPELLGSKWLFKTFMRLMMPKKRASDNVALSADFPQEEEFAIGNMNPYAYYNFWYFPKRTQEYYRKYVEFEGVSKNLVQQWKSDYVRLAKKALLNTDGSRFISKNPPHTGRIKTLLDIFPNAKFIFIYRNPVTVFISTKRLIQTTIPAVQFQHLSEREMEENILWTYDRMLPSYFEHKAVIPEGNLVEVKFENFENNELSILEKIYTQLDIAGFEEVKPKFVKYIESQKSYKKNKYKISKSQVDEILAHWQFAMDHWGYEMPDNLEIIDNYVGRS